jgi:hypothetical protein
MVKSIKILSGVFAAILVTTILASVVYKLSDEKLLPETQEYFKTEPEVMERIQKTAAFLNTFEVKENLTKGFTICTDQKGNNELIDSSKNWESFKVEHSKEFKEAINLSKIENINFDYSSFTIYIRQLNKFRELTKILENEGCYLLKTKKKAQAISLFERIYKQSLNSLQLENPVLSVIIFSGQAINSAEKLKDIEKKNSVLGLSLKQVETLDTETLFQKAARADVKAVIGGFERPTMALFSGEVWKNSGFIGTIELLIEELTHKNYLKNQLMKFIKQNRFAEVTSEYIFPYTPMKMEKVIIDLSTNRIGDSKERLAIKIDQLKKIVN